MSVAEQSPEPHLTVLPPEEAARRAQPLPSDEEMALDDVTVPFATVTEMRYGAPSVVTSNGACGCSLAQR